MPKKVVIVGGGYSGTQLATALDKTFDVTLIAGAEVFRHLIAGLRSTVLLENIPRMLIPYDNLLRRGAVRTCLATKINAEACTVTIATGEDLPYDFLVLATGVLHPKTVGVGGGTQTVREQTNVFKESGEHIKAANDILILGGGPNGVEMAGEIKEELPNKSVTLVTSNELCPSPEVPLPQKFRAKLRAKLERVGVTVYTDAGRVNYSDEDTTEGGLIIGRRIYRWAGGGIEADLCIVATGWREIPKLYADSGLESWLDNKGFVMVEKTFEVKGAGAGGKVFAMGDCVDLPLPKSAYCAGAQADAVAKQVAISAAGRPLMNAVPSILPVCFVPIGKSGGVSALPMGFVVGDFITRKVKAADMLTNKFWALCNAGKPPAMPK